MGSRIGWSSDRRSRGTPTSLTRSGFRPRCARRSRRWSRGRRRVRHWATRSSITTSTTGARSSDCSTRSSPATSASGCSSVGSFAVVNPATEEAIAELEQVGVEETDAAVGRARAAFPAWRAVTPSDRARLLRRLATLIEEHAEELARIETRNVGKPIADSRGEVGMVADVFHFYAGAVDKHHGETIPVAGGVDLTFREPLGVVGLIVPWNFPLNISSC